MGLLEWIGEGYNPGEIGSVQVGREGPPPRSRAAVIARAVVAIALVGGVYLLIAAGIPELSLGGWAIVVGVTLAYLFIAFWIRPAPEMSNVGWLGGMIDHPFRYSDDINRMALFLLISSTRGVLWRSRWSICCPWSSARRRGRRAAV